MKPNAFRERLKEGKVPVGHMIVEFGTRGMPKLLEAAGADFAVIDTEHSGFGIAELADMLANFKATPVAPFVRIPQIDYHFIARALDLGALGIMAPNVKRAEEARALVRAAKYPSLGERGLMLGGALTDFRSVKARDFMAYSNDNTTIICQIESPEALANLDAIAAVEGVDVLWVGQGDLTLAMGIPGQFEDERFIEALTRVAETARMHGLAAGIQPRDLAQARAWSAFGFNVLSMSADIFVYGQALSEHIAEARKITGGS